jgi:hypothetical protein
MGTLVVTFLARDGRSNLFQEIVYRQTDGLGHTVAAA